jgi:DNA-binding CsgD family transcriptional regulator
LGLTDGTVRWHLRHVYHKLHVRSRTEAALKLLCTKSE